MAVTSSVVVTMLFIYWIATFIIHWQGLKLVPKLPSAKIKQSNQQLISIIIAARNEEKSIIDTIESLNNQEYQNVEIIVVNDRSTDQTGIIVERFIKDQSNQSSQSSIKLIHIHELPKGWLGKNYALLQGYLNAKGDYLLFTDADISFSADAIGSAMDFFHKHQLDHFTLMPFLAAKSFWLRGFIHFFVFLLYLSKWPWKPNDDRQKKQGIGVGAFNLITRCAYQKIGTHEKLALRPDDDIQLGMLVKKAGLKQRFLFGAQYLEVEWYPSFSTAIKGLEKNIFAGFNYSLVRLVFIVFAIVFFNLLPFIGLLFFEGWQFILNGTTILFVMALFLIYTRKLFKDSGFDVLVFPILVVLLIYIFIRSSLLTIMRGGIYWRGTFYSLKELKNR